MHCLPISRYSSFPKGPLSRPHQLRPRHHRVRTCRRRRVVRGPARRDASKRHDADPGGLPQLASGLCDEKKVWPPRDRLEEHTSSFARQQLKRSTCVAPDSGVLVFVLPKTSLSGPCGVVDRLLVHALDQKERSPLLSAVARLLLQRGPPFVPNRETLAVVHAHASSMRCDTCPWLHRVSNVVSTISNHQFSDQGD